MTTEEALKYLEANNPEVKDEVKSPSEETETKTEGQQDETPAPVEIEQGDESTEAKESESDESDEKKSDDGKKENHTNKEKRDYAFIREKNKRKAQREQYERKIAELQAEVNKYKNLKKDDFNGDEEAYINYKLDERDNIREIRRQQEEVDSLYQQELDDENDRRIELSFSNEEEKAEYRELLENRGQEFLSALQKYDPQGTVLSYLNDTECYPKILKKLMTDTEALKSVFKYKDSYHRIQALDQISKSFDAPKPKKKLPVIGRQTTSSSNSDNVTHDNDYWNNYLKNHPRGR